MDALNTIQKISKIGRIVSKIGYIMCMVGVIGCLVGVVSLAVIPDGLKIGGVTLHSMIENNSEMNMNNVYASMAVGAVFCAGYCVLCKLAVKYFENELKAGTPFTFDGAHELLRLGVYNICISVGMTVAASIVFAVMSQFMDGIKDASFDNGSSVGFGIMLIFASLLCKYGTEIKSKTEESNENSGV